MRARGEEQEGRQGGRGGRGGQLGSILSQQGRDTRTHFDSPVIAYQQVRWFNVSMNDLVTVHCTDQGEAEQDMTKRNMT